MDPICQYPLEKITNKQIQLLEQALWSWPVNQDNKAANTTLCEDDGRNSRRSRLARYVEYYKSLTASFENEEGNDETMILSCHEDLFGIVQQLKSYPGMSRGDITHDLTSVAAVDESKRRQCLQSMIQDKAIDLAVKVMFMVDCSSQHYNLSLLEHGIDNVPWRNDSTLAQFITEIFPQTDHPNINDEDSKAPIDMKSALKARKLKKIAGLKFRATDDLRSHLKLDHKHGTVEIFHHTAFLKEHLRLTKDAPHDLSVLDCLERGALPRQIALEALDSIQKILFPLSDAKSYSLLRSLTATASFDPDCLRFDSASIRNSDEKDIRYLYFGSRLADLYEELENPQPRGWAVRWLERKSRARHVMMATIVGVIIAIFLGVAGLSVGGYQAWVSYQQWQHPISSPSGSG